MGLTRLFRKFRRRTRLMGGSKELREAAFRQFVERETAKRSIRPYRARRGRTREARRWSQWVVYKERYAVGGHRAAPKAALGRLLATFRSVEAD